MDLYLRKSHTAHPARRMQRPA